MISLYLAEVRRVQREITMNASATPQTNEKPKALTNQRRKRLNLIGSLVSQENIIRVLGFYKSLVFKLSTEPERDWLSEMGRKDSDVAFWPHNC